MLKAPRMSCAMPQVNQSPPWKMRSSIFLAGGVMISLDRVLAIAIRIIRQFRRDRRTLALVVIVPSMIMTLVSVAVPDQGTPGATRLIDFIAPALLGGFVFMFVFILTGVGFLRERQQGTLDRLLVSPASKVELVAGYMVGFFIFALVQSGILLMFTIFVLDVDSQGPVWSVFLVEMVIVVGSVSMGIFASTFARNEFQVMQFIPLFIIPQFLLSGIFWPVLGMPGYLQAISKVLPLTYAIRGLQHVMLDGSGLLGIGFELGILGAFAAGTSLLSALVLRRGVA